MGILVVKIDLNRGRYTTLVIGWCRQSPHHISQIVLAKSMSLPSHHHRGLRRCRALCRVDVKVLSCERVKVLFSKRRLERCLQQTVMLQIAL
ncbi:Uncharacterised protein [Vibrio cholerae]|nr:Uncharacterised protein [Vibrio cholerae]CSB55784.1 Uncharacterised protein [Vibrio cholerae]CSB93968.1 Uncharacterised protein [Vibrio cholerae]